TQYDQLNVAGLVILDRGPLNVALGFNPAPGNTFKIINNDSQFAVDDFFGGLPEGTIFSATTGSFSGNFQISYQGGDGNDVVLTAVNASNPVLQGTPGDDGWLVKRNGNNDDITLNGNLIWSTPI